MRHLVPCHFWTVSRRIVGAALALALACPPPALALDLLKVEQSVESGPLVEHLAETVAAGQGGRVGLEAVGVRQVHPVISIGLSGGMADFAQRFPRPPAGVWDPGHETTQLMLEAMERLAPIVRRAEVLDTGAGSGILSVAAVDRFGAKSVVATEPDLEPLEVVRHNVRRFDIADRVKTFRGSLLDPVLDQRFDVAICNAPNQWLAEAYVSHVASVLKTPQGVSLLMWHRRGEAVLQSIAHGHGLVIEPILTDSDGWRIYAITRTRARLAVLENLMTHSAVGAGMEETDASAGEMIVRHVDEVLHGAPIDPEVGIPLGTIHPGNRFEVLVGELNEAHTETRETAHTYDEYYLAIGGEGVLEMSGQQFPLVPMMIAHVPPGVKHRMSIRPGAGPFRWLIINPPEASVPPAAQPLPVAPPPVRSLHEAALATFFTDAMGRTVDIARLWNWWLGERAEGSSMEFMTATRTDGPQLLYVVDGQGRLEIGGRSVDVMRGTAVVLPPDQRMRLFGNPLAVVFRPHGERAVLDDWPARQARLLALDHTVASLVEPLTTDRSETAQRRHEWAARSWRAIIRNVQASGAFAAARTPDGYQYDWPRDSWEVTLTLIKLNRDLRNADLDQLIRAHIDFIWHSAQTYGWHPFTQKIHLQDGFMHDIWGIQPDTAGLAVLALCAYCEALERGEVPGVAAEAAQTRRDEYFRRIQWFANAIAQEGWDPTLTFNGYHVTDMWEQVFGDRYLATEWINLAALREAERLAKRLEFPHQSWYWRNKANLWGKDVQNGVARYEDPAEHYYRAHLSTKASDRQKDRLDSQVFVTIGGRSAASRAGWSPRDSALINTFRRLDALFAEQFPINRGGRPFAWGRWRGDFWRDTQIREVGTERTTPWFLPSFWRVEFLNDAAEEYLNDAPYERMVQVGEVERQWHAELGVRTTRTPLALGAGMLAVADEDLDRLLQVADRNLETLRAELGTGASGPSEAQHALDSLAFPEQFDEQSGAALGPRDLTWAAGELFALLRRRQALHQRLAEAPAQTLRAGAEETDWRAVRLADIQDDPWYALGRTQMQRTRVVNAMMRLRLRTLGEVYAHPPEDLVQQSGMGDGGIAWLRALFEGLGVRWGNAPPAEPASPSSPVADHVPPAGVWKPWQEVPDRLVVGARVQHALGTGTLLSRSADGRQVEIQIGRKRWVLSLGSAPLSVYVEEPSSPPATTDSSTIQPAPPLAPASWYVQFAQAVPPEAWKAWREIAGEIKRLQPRPVRTLLPWEANQLRGSRAYEALVLCLACLQRDGRLPNATQLATWLQGALTGGSDAYKTLETRFAVLGEAVPATWRLQHPADGSRRDSTPLTDVASVRAELNEFLEDGTLPGAPPVEAVPMPDEASPLPVDGGPAQAHLEPADIRATLQRMVNGHRAIISERAGRDRYRLFTVDEQEAMRAQVRDEARANRLREPVPHKFLTGKRFKAEANPGIRRRDSASLSAGPDDAELKARVDERVTAAAYERAIALNALTEEDFSAVLDRISKAAWAREALEKLTTAILQAVTERFEGRPTSVKEVFDALREGMALEDPDLIVQFVEAALSEQTAPSFYERQSARPAVGLEEAGQVLTRIRAQVQRAMRGQFGPNQIVMWPQPDGSGIGLGVDTTDAAGPAFDIAPWSLGRMTLEIPVIDPLEATDPTVRAARRYQTTLKIRDEYVPMPPAKKEAVTRMIAQAQRVKAFSPSATRDQVLPAVRTLINMTRAVVSQSNGRQSGDGSQDRALADSAAGRTAIADILATDARLQMLVQEVAKAQVQLGSTQDAILIRRVATPLLGVLEPWPRQRLALQPYVERLPLFGAADATPLRQFLANVTEAARQSDTRALIARGAPEALQEVYDLAWRQARLTQLDGLAGGFARLDISWKVLAAEALAATWHVVLREQEAAAAALMRANVRLAADDLSVTRAPIGGVGVLFLREGAVRRFVPGGGGVVTARDLTATYSASRLQQWYEIGDDIALLYTGPLNVEQLFSFFESWFRVHEHVPGTPRLLLGLALPDGTVRLQDLLVAPHDTAAWTRAHAPTVAAFAAYRQFLSKLKEGSLPEALRASMPAQEAAHLLAALQQPDDTDAVIRQVAQHFAEPILRDPQFWRSVEIPGVTDAPPVMNSAASPMAEALPLPAPGDPAAVKRAEKRAEFLSRAQSGHGAAAKIRTLSTITWDELPTLIAQFLEQHPDKPFVRFMGWLTEEHEFRLDRASVIASIRAADNLRALEAIPRARFDGDPVVDEAVRAVRTTLLQALLDSANTLDALRALAPQMAAGDQMMGELFRLRIHAVAEQSVTAAIRQWELAARRQRAQLDLPVAVLQEVWSELAPTRVPAWDEIRRTAKAQVDMVRRREEPAQRRVRLERRFRAELLDILRGFLIKRGEVEADDREMLVELVAHVAQDAEQPSVPWEQLVKAAVDCLAAHEGMGPQEIVAAIVDLLDSGVSLAGVEAVFQEAVHRQADSPRGLADVLAGDDHLTIVKSEDEFLQPFRQPREKVVAGATGLEEGARVRGDIVKIQELLTATLQEAWKTLGAPGQLAVVYPKSRRVYRYSDEGPQLVEWDVGFVSLSKRGGAIANTRFTINPGWVNTLAMLRRQKLLDIPLGMESAEGTPLTFGKALIWARMAHPMALMVQPPKTHQPIRLENAWDYPTAFLTPATLGAELVHMRLIDHRQEMQAVSARAWSEMIRSFPTSLQPFLRASRVSQAQFVQNSYAWIERLCRPVALSDTIGATPSSEPTVLPAAAESRPPAELDVPMVDTSMVLPAEEAGTITPKDDQAERQAQLDRLEEETQQLDLQIARRVFALAQRSEYVDPAYLTSDRVLMEHGQEVVTELRAILETGQTTTELTVDKYGQGTAMQLLVSLMLEALSATQALVKYMTDSKWQGTLGVEAKAVVSGYLKKRPPERKGIDPEITEALNPILTSEMIPWNIRQSLREVIAATPDGAPKTPVSHSRRTGLEEGGREDLEALVAAWHGVQAWFTGDAARPIFILFDGVGPHLPLVAKSGVLFGVRVQTEEEAESARRLLRALPIPPQRYEVWVGDLSSVIHRALERFEGYGQLEIIAVSDGPEIEAALREAGLVWAGLEEATLQKTREYFTKARREATTYGGML